MKNKKYIQCVTVLWVNVDVDVSGMRKNVSEGKTCLLRHEETVTDIHTGSSTLDNRRLKKRCLV